MALSKDLMGVGIPAEQALLLGYSAYTAVSAAGTTSADATVIKKQNNNINLTATGSDGIRMPADAELNRPYSVANTSGSTGKVYPHTGGTLNGGSTDAGVSLTTLKSIEVIRLSTTAWFYVGSL